MLPVRTWLLSAPLLLVACGDQGPHGAGAPTAGSSTITSGPGPSTSVSTGTTPPAVRINEFIRRTTASDHDWVELFNAAPAEVDLSGWILADEGDVFVLPPGTSIAPGGFLLLSSQLWGGTADLRYPFQLGTTDELTLMAPDGSVADAHAWANILADEVYGRSADGVGAIERLLYATPGGSNAPYCAGSPSVVPPNEPQLEAEVGLGEVGVSPPAAADVVLVASGQDQALAVWSEGSHVLATRLDPSGIALDSEPLVVTEGGAGVSAAAWNGVHWLVVWSDASAPGLFVGRRVAPDGSLVDAVDLPLVVGTDPVQVAPDGGGFVVMAPQSTPVWSWWITAVDAAGVVEGPFDLGFDGTSSRDGLVYDGVRHIFAGSDEFGDRNVFVRELDVAARTVGPPIYLTSGPNQLSVRAALHDGSQPAVVWNDTAGGVYGVHLGADLLAVEPAPVALASPGALIVAGASATGHDGQVLLIGEEQGSGDLRATTFAADGSVTQLGTFTDFEITNGTGSIGVASTGGAAVAVWLERMQTGAAFLDYGVRTSTLEAGAWRPEGESLAASMNAQWRPDVAYGASGGLVVWADTRGGIRAALVDEQGAQQGAEIVVSSGEGDTDPSVASDGAGFRVIWLEDAGTTELGVPATALVGEDGVVGPVTYPAGSDLASRVDVTHDGWSWAVTWMLADLGECRLGWLDDAGLLALPASPVSGCQAVTAADGHVYLLDGGVVRLDPSGLVTGSWASRLFGDDLVVQADHVAVVGSQPNDEDTWLELLPVSSDACVGDVTPDAPVELGSMDHPRVATGPDGALRLVWDVPDPTLATPWQDEGPVRVRLQRIALP